MSDEEAKWHTYPDVVHALAALAEEARAAREAWITYRGDDLAEDERLLAKAEELHAEWRRRTDEAAPLIEANRLVPAEPE